MVFVIVNKLYFKFTLGNETDLWFRESLWPFDRISMFLKILVNFFDFHARDILETIIIF